MKERFCRKCGTILTIENTFPSWLKIHNNLCKYCWQSSKENKEIQQRYYQKNKAKMIKRAIDWRKLHPDESKEYSRKYKRKIRLEILRHYSLGEPKCSCCGETHVEFLTIDHIKGYKNSPDYKKVRRRSGTEFYVWLKNNNYPTGYRILCFNCNMSLGIWGYCPHNKNKSSQGQVWRI
jgi:hypothetical protein